MQNKKMIFKYAYNSKFKNKEKTYIHIYTHKN